jgi:hypothetical protein
VHGELPKLAQSVAILVRVDTIAAMRDFLILFVHLIVTVTRLAGPAGLRSVVSESVLVRHQLLILNRGRKRAPNLSMANYKMGRKRRGVTMLPSATAASF